MPDPTTEVLNDDLKEIRSELHRIELSLGAKISQVETALSSAIAKLSAEFGLFKWLVGAALLSSISGVITSAFWAGSLASRVNNLEVRVDKVDSRLDRIESSLTVINSRLDRIEVSLSALTSRFDRFEAEMTSRFDRFEASLAKVVGRADGAGTSPPAPR